MFKRILSSLIGRAAEPPAPVAPADVPQGAANKMVTAYDAHGREIKIARGDWRDKVYLPNLQRAWNDADALYGQIIAGLGEGFAPDLKPAAERLMAIDPLPERSHTILGIVLMKNGELQAAEGTLRAGMEKAGETGTLLTNLAKVFSERGDQARAEATLWRAVQADPNLDNGLMWWLAIARDRGGEDGYVRALRTAAALPDSWRARLWLARHHLQRQEVDAAVGLYREVLASGRFDRGALMMISGDLGNQGQLGLILDLVGPVYDERRHDPMAGLNLLQACQQLGRIDEGEALLNRLYALQLSPIKQHLDRFAQAFGEQRQREAKGTPVDVDALRFATLSIDVPIWQYGLRGADWLFSPKAEEAPKVCFFALSKRSDGSERAESQREDDVGRMTRAIPLYLAEAVHYWSDCSARTFITIVEGGGPVVSGQETDGSDVFDIVPGGTTFFVTGEIGASGAGADARWRLSLKLWDAVKRARVAVEEGEAGARELGELVLSLEQRLRVRIGAGRREPVDAFYLRPTPEVMPAYLAELAQSFMLTLLANGKVPKSGLWGERAMLDWPLKMALHWPTVEVPRLMFISGLAKAGDYRSDVLPEFKESALQLLREAKRSGSASARLAPLAWKLFGMTDVPDAHEMLAGDPDPAYRAWLDRVSTLDARRA